jgi:signal peptidase II
MLPRHIARWAVPFVLAVTVLLLDQLTKLWVLANLGPVPMTKFVPVIGDTVRIAYTQNTGVSFSMFQGQSDLLIFVALVIVAGAISFYWTQLPNHQLLVQLLLGLIVGGAIGNVIDRVRLGFVVDFIQVGWFPVFNLADSAVFVGAVLLILQFLREEQDARRNRRSAASADRGDHQDAREPAA